MTILLESGVFNLIGFWVSLVICLLITAGLIWWNTPRLRRQKKVKRIVTDKLIHKRCTKKSGTALCGTNLGSQRLLSKVTCVVCDDLYLLFTTGDGPCPVCGTYCEDVEV